MFGPDSPVRGRPFLLGSVVGALVLSVALVLLGLGATPAGATTLQQGTATTTGTVSPTATAACQSGTVQVNIQNFTFVPSTLTVCQGATVRWTNLDTVAHTSTSNDGVWDSGLIPQNSSFSFTFNTPGSYDYHCTPHPFMQGTINVVAQGTVTATVTGTVTPGTGTPAATGTATTTTPVATTTTPVATTTTPVATTTTPAATGTATTTSTPVATTTPAATNTLAPTATGTATAVPTATATTEPVGPRDLVVVRAFIDFRCDSFFNYGTDIPLTNLPISVSGAASASGVTNNKGETVLGIRRLMRGQSVVVSGPAAPTAPGWVGESGFTLVPCPGSPSVRVPFEGFGPFGVKYVDIRYNISGPLTLPTETPAATSTAYPTPARTVTATVAATATLGTPGATTTPSGTTTPAATTPAGTPGATASPSATTPAGTPGVTPAPTMVMPKR